MGDFIVYTRPPIPHLSAGGGFEPLTKFSKTLGALTGSKFLEGIIRKEEVEFFKDAGWGGVLQILHKR